MPPNIAHIKLYPAAALARLRSMPGQASACALAGSLLVATACTWLARTAEQPADAVLPAPPAPALPAPALPALDAWQRFPAISRSYVSPAPRAARLQPLIRLPLTERRVIMGTVVEHLYDDAYWNGTSPEVLAQLVHALSDRINLITADTRGDQYRLIVDTEYSPSGAFRGKVLVAAALRHGDDLYEVFRHAAADGKVHYLSRSGISLSSRQAFTYPLRSARISSAFNMRRMHPILKRIRPHKGTDFAAPEGTPIQATRTGTVRFVGRNAGYGNTVEIQHNGGYLTRYAHMQKPAGSLSVGDRVRQGQVIGYVGSTGLATGPHLHYEVRLHGQPLDPMILTRDRQVHISKAELLQFRHRVVELQKHLDVGFAAPDLVVR
jgi:murein DD-endopeptidase MepM/ murein hydrolase activator NlpD